MPTRNELQRSRREELAWAAGIFDGEGYIGVVNRRVPSHGRRVPQLHVYVDQYHDREVVDRFCAAVGVGKVTDRIRPGGVHDFYWRVNSLEDVQATVALLWPWLSSPKRDQAHWALSSYHSRRAVIGVRAWKKQRRADT